MIIRFSCEEESNKFRVSMAKVPSESRIPTLGSRIPIPGKTRILPKINLRNIKPEVTAPDPPPPLILEQPLNATISIPKLCPIIDNTNSTICKVNTTIVKSVSPIKSTTQVLATEDVNETFVKDAVTLDRSMLIIHDITANDIGKPVCVGNTQTGVLRYFGEVQFNAGLWCGVELDRPVGKHDGCVKGVRYFQCRENCGIMAPVSNVALCSDHSKSTTKIISTERNDISGPFSLLEIKTMAQRADREKENKAEQDLATQINPESVSPVKSKRISCILSSNWYTNSRANVSASSTLNSDKFNMLLQNSKNKSTPMEMIDNEDRVHVFPDMTDVSFSKCFASIKVTSSPGRSPSDGRTFAKENSFEYDESLGILTPDQMLEFSPFVENSKTPSSEDLKSLLSSKPSDKTLSNSRTSSSENLGILPDDGFKLPAATALDLDVNSGSEIPELDINLKQSLEIPLKLSSIIQSDISLSSPNAVESSAIDFSLGIIDDDVLMRVNQFSSKLETTANIDLSLDFINRDGKFEDFKSISRSDQTPSPEDLPLDPIDSTKSVDMDLENPLSNPSTDSDIKTDVSKSTTAIKTNSFITSVTSITSLDTGYQGDGEMSRPASRGADHSPIAHKPNNPALANLHWQRAITRRQDPMTDSDFFTESDADVHDDNNAARGDRRAQVIDGTLYGAHAQASAAAHDIYIANQEEMESSGVFTDMELNARTEDFSDGERNRMDIVNDDKSPSDISSKSISENSQAVIEQKDQNMTITNETKSISPIEEINETLTAEKIQSPSRTPTPSPKDENPNKKLKIPARGLTTKVKTPVKTKQTETESQESRKSVKKNVNRWDAIMKKISKGQTDNSKVKLKEVKSKVATTIMASNKRFENEKPPMAEISTATKTKIRRVRARGEPLARPKSNSRTTSSVHSSVSDVSVGITTQKQPATHPTVTRVVKKREGAVGRCSTTVTEVLTPSGHKPTPLTAARAATTNIHRPIRELKKSPISTSAAAAPDGKALGGRRTPTRRIVGAAPAHKPKDQSRVTGASPQKGGSPARNQTLPERTQVANYLPQLQHSAKGVEALGVLLQYLVFNLDAFRTPILKRELQSIKSQWLRDKLELEETRMGYRRLEDLISEQKILAAQTLEEDRVRFRAEITELFEKQKREITELNEKSKEEKQDLERRLQEQNAELKLQLDAEISNRESEIELRVETFATEHRYRLQQLEQDKERLRQDHQIAVEILREENESIREQLDEKTFLIEDLNELRFRNEKLKKEFCDKERILEEKLIFADDEIAVLKEENKKILETFKSDTKDNKLQTGSPEKCSVLPQAALGRCTQLQDEVESLRTVLDLKLAELSELRRAHGELSQAAEELPAALLRTQMLQARVEDLEIQLERKTEVEMQLTKENKRLHESYNQETKQKMRISLHNEELQWKLKQNSEVVNAILQGQTPNRKSLHGSNQSLSDDTPYRNTCSGGGYLSRSLHTSSFNEKHHGTSPHILERTFSFREKGSSLLRDARKPDSSNDRFSSGRADYLELEYSPPSSPKVKGVVEKSDSVSWVLDMDEAPEVLASRMVRRAGSFRNVTPPKSTPTKSPASKRPRTKSNNLSLSASAGAIVSPEAGDSPNDNRHRSKSVSLRDSQSPDSNCHPGEYLSNSWHYSLRTSTPTKSGLETIRSGTKLENNPDLEHDSDAALSLPTLPSEIIRKKEVAKPDSLPSLPSGDLLLLQSAFPKNSAGEAMISESNSEDECSSSTSERSPSASDTDTSEEQTGGSTDKCGEKHSKMQYDLFLMTESTTNSEVMDCSWSEELDV